MFLKNFITQKDDVVTKNATLQEVVSKMFLCNLHHVVIVEEGKPIGIITERDIVCCFSKGVDFSLLAIEFAMKDIIKLHGTRLIEYALSIMINYNIRKIVVVDTHNNYLGCVEQEELVYRLEEAFFDTSEEIHRLLNQNNQAIIINQNSTLESALHIMTKNGLNSLLIHKESGEPVGIISESDIIKLAQQHIDQNCQVKDFIHFPIIQMEGDKSIDEMIHTMQKANIRKMVVFSKEDKSYHIVSSKDLAIKVQGNYTKFLESKLYDTRDTFNALSEYVIELIDIDDEQIIYWTNHITKRTFGVNLDDGITKIIPQETWDNLFLSLKENKILYKTIMIEDRYYEVKGHYGTITGEKIIKLFLNDITETTLLIEKLKSENIHKERLLFEQAKMVQMGEMIGNIAHQWRQPLSLITTSASGILFKQEYGILKKEDISEWMNKILDGANYLSQTIDTFRNFLKEKKELKEIVLQERLENTFKLIEASLKNNYISLEKNLDSENPIIMKLVAGELEQVLINILNNAKDVLLEKKVSDGWIKVKLKKLNSAVIVSIEDNGGGIDDAILPHIFDKYFTTKEESKGTGLGLYMSQRIISESLGGKLSVKNSEFGAQFLIELPLNS